MHRRGKRKFSVVRSDEVQESSPLMVCLEKISEVYSERAMVLLWPHRSVSASGATAHLTGTSENSGISSGYENSG
jgi:hypothetical protein